MELGKQGDMELYIPKSSNIANVLRSDSLWETRVHDYICNTLDVGDVGIDLGAHVGTHATTMRSQVGGDGFVGVIEPNKTLTDYFRNTVMYHDWDNVSICECAIGDSDNQPEAKIAVPQPQEDSNPVNYGAAKLEELLFSTMDAQETFTTPVRSLEDAIDHFDVSTVDLLKIDIEGNEYEALYPLLQSSPKRILNCIIEMHPFVGGIQEHTELLNRISDISTSAGCTADYSFHSLSPETHYDSMTTRYYIYFST